jgi:hypothetical protein
MGGRIAIHKSGCLLTERQWATESYGFPMLVLWNPSSEADSRAAGGEIPWLTWDMCSQVPLTSPVFSQSYPIHTFTLNQYRDQATGLNDRGYIPSWDK